MPAHQRGEPVLPEHVGGQLPVAGRERVPQGLERLPLGRVPARRAAVQLGLLARQAAVQLRAQHVGEQAVVAIPAGPPVDLAHERVRPRQLVQGPAGRGLARERLRQLTAERVGHARAQQEVEQRRAARTRAPRR